MRFCKFRETEAEGEILINPDAVGLVRPSPFMDDACDIYFRDGAQTITVYGDLLSVQGELAEPSK